MDNATKEQTISQIVTELPRLRVFDEEISDFEDKHFVSSIPVEDKNTYIGIEIEAENVRTWDDSYSPYWRMVEDGSLRNSGREFVTVPIKAFRVENALTCLFDSQINKDIEFTERTSVHIHMNVRTMTLEQLKAMILLYLLFERALFRYVNAERYENIFCVPLIETSFGEHLINLFHGNRLSISWSKYTALNLLPIFEKGTIEFRHLHGTKNIKEIIGWINLILCLKKMALKNDPKVIWDRIETLNTLSQYHSFASEVFGEYIVNLNSNFLEKDIASCCTYIKTKCFKNDWATEIANSIAKESPLYKFSSKARNDKMHEEIRRRTQDTLNDVTRTLVPPSPWNPVEVEIDTLNNQRLEAAIQRLRNNTRAEEEREELNRQVNVRSTTATQRATRPSTDFLANTFVEPQTRRVTTRPRTR